MTLLNKTPFDTITVQDVLDRAHVSRSTFYTHYSDKDDLLMSDAEEFFEHMAMALSVHGDQSERVFPVQEFFAHLSDVQPKPQGPLKICDLKRSTQTQLAFEFNSLELGANVSGRASFVIKTWPETHAADADLGLTQAPFRWNLRRSS
jgi:AcrR family transcriptional regulator